MQVQTKAQDACSVYGSDWTSDPKAELSSQRITIAVFNFSGCAQKLRSPVSFVLHLSRPGHLGLEH